LKIFEVIHGSKEVSITMTEPSILTIENLTTNIKSYYVLHKGALKDVCNGIGISHSASKGLYRAHPRKWLEFINEMMVTNEFNLNHLSYIVESGTSNVISISGNNDKLVEQIEEFEALIDTFDVMAYVRNTSSTIQIMLKSKDSKDVDPCIIAIDIDTEYGVYYIYNGMSNKDGIILLNVVPVIITENISDFLSINIKYELEISEKLSALKKLDYDTVVASKISLSVREVFEILKRSKVRVECDENGLAESINDFEESGVIIEFLDSFNMTYKSLKKISALRNSFKINKLSLEQMMEVLSLEYYNKFNNVNNVLMSYMYNLYYTKEIDEIVITEEQSK